MSARLALRGTHISWHQRLEYVAEALAGAEYDKDVLHARWTEARQECLMSSSQAYEYVVALYLSIAIEKADADFTNKASAIQTELPSDARLATSMLDFRGSSLAKLKVLPRWCTQELDPTTDATLLQNLPQHSENDDGFPVTLGTRAGCTKYYCGRILGKDLIPNSDGQCGPCNGPQCASCGRLQASHLDLEVSDQMNSRPNDAPYCQQDRTVLWFGDIPASKATQNFIEMAIGHCKPRTMPPPFIYKVVKKSYRGPGPEIICRAEAADGQAVGGELKDSSHQPWFGFAIIAFRDSAEAAEALDFFQGMDAGSGWRMCIKWADPCFQCGIKRGGKKGPRLESGKHPPLGEQLFPISFQGSELSAAMNRHLEYTNVPLTAYTEWWIVAEVIKAYYRQAPRQEIRAAGQQIPSDVLSPLLQELETTRWPAALHRFGMQSEQYLVLHRGGVNVGYEKLLALLEVLLTWADPSFACNRVALTKDFQGSPHVDSSDVSPQYCCSLGDFDSGGQLCIEGKCPGEVYIVDTHNRMAKVDGRRVHWVCGHSGGTRFSIVFFATNPANYTELGDTFYADFVPHGHRLA